MRLIPLAISDKGDVSEAVRSLGSACVHIAALRHNLGLERWATELLRCFGWDEYGERLEPLLATKVKTWSGWIDVMANRQERGEALRYQRRKLPRRKVKGQKPEPRDEREHDHCGFLRQADGTETVIHDDDARPRIVKRDLDHDPACPCRLCRLGRLHPLSETLPCKH